LEGEPDFLANAANTASLVRSAIDKYLFDAVQSRLYSGVPGACLIAHHLDHPITRRLVRHATDTTFRKAIFHRFAEP
jgi:hypothetical protein